jgi:hypothetical protein
VPASRGARCGAMRCVGTGTGHHARVWDVIVCGFF